jgi:hypothetical protein
MNIYCNGDSFTAGEELLDYQFAGWPGYRSTGSYYSPSMDFDLRQWSTIRQQHAHNIFGSFEHFYEKEKEQSWAGQLSKITKNISVINGAVSGSTIAGINNRTTIDLITHRDKKFDFIFIQLTSPNRIGFYNSDLLEKYFMKEHPIGHLEKFSKIQQEIAKKYIECYSDKEFAIQYLYAMIGLKHTVKGLTGLYPIFLSSHKIWKDYIVNPLLTDKKLCNDKKIQILIKDSGILDIPNENIMEDAQLRNNFLHTPLKHFEPRCHEEFAKILYNKYINPR